MATGPQRHVCAGSASDGLPGRNALNEAFPVRKFLKIKTESLSIEGPDLQKPTSGGEIRRKVVRQQVPPISFFDPQKHSSTRWHFCPPVSKC